MRSCYVKNLGFPFPILESCEPDDEPVDFFKWLGWLDRKFQLESNYIYMYLHPGKKHQRFQDLRPCSELCLFSGKERVVCSPVLRTAFCPRRWFNRGFLAFFWTWTKAYPKFWEPGILLDFMLWIGINPAKKRAPSNQQASTAMFFFLRPHPKEEFLSVQPGDFLELIERMEDTWKEWAVAIMVSSQKEGLVPLKAMEAWSWCVVI